MARYLSILFLSIYLFTVVQVNELFKIPNMFEHYQEHQQGTESISLWQFICMHYMKGEVYDDDYDKDMKLPFKSHSSNCLCSFIFCPVIQNYSFSSKFFFKELKRQKFTYTFSFTSSYLSSIWQPPQFV
jgi:hypothetical protein